MQSAHVNISLTLVYSLFYTKNQITLNLQLLNLQPITLNLQLLNNQSVLNINVLSLTEL